MTKHLDRLKDLLVAETELARALLVVVENKQEALLHTDGERLNAAVERERTLLKATNDLERERATALTTVAAGLGGEQKNVGTVTLAELAARLDPNEAARIRELGQSLKAVIGRIQERNHQNRILLESSSRFVRNTLRILTGDFGHQLVDQRI